ncbi:helix-turn-helix domain-containing protein [Streptomyces sp. NPDC058439]|uniref:helix-turn-helix domain-containing protein n=1 Tax=Streptomyces sp. NPDC058439 TaxID=3346500 RepID=UPI00365F29C8
MGNTFSSDHCKWCGGRRTLQHTGRPGEYCSTKCRQAAHTERRKGLPPDTSEFDHFLHGELDAACAEIRDLQRALRTSASAVEQPLERLLQLQRRIDQLTPTVVGRTKRLGASWEVIGQLLGMNKDTVRKKYNSSVVQRALTRAHVKGLTARAAPRQIPAAVPPPPAESFPPQPFAVRAAPLDDAADSESESAEPSPDTGLAPGPGDFACVLSNLQRASRYSLRTLSKKTKLSPSFLSRTMNGERFPSWEATASIARACGADPEVLRKVWEDADARRSRKSQPETLTSALRYLHQRAGSPTPWSMSVNSGHALAQDRITNLLNGTTTGTWEDVQALVQTLDGETTYFKPLWRQATTEHATPTPAPAPQSPDQGTTSRIEELITAFSNVLSTTTRPTTPRRPLPAPIQAATTWASR